MSFLLLAWLAEASSSTLGVGSKDIHYVNTCVRYIDVTWPTLCIYMVRYTHIGLSETDMDIAHGEINLEETDPGYINLGDQT